GRVRAAGPLREGRPHRRRRAAGGGGRRRAAGGAPPQGAARSRRRDGARPPDSGPGAHVADQVRGAGARRDHLHHPEVTGCDAARAATRAPSAAPAPADTTSASTEPSHPGLVVISHRTPTARPLLAKAETHVPRATSSAATDAGSAAASASAAARPSSWKRRRWPWPLAASATRAAMPTTTHGVV